MPAPSSSPSRNKLLAALSSGDLGLLQSHLTRVTLKLRLAPFETHTRSITGEPTQDGLELYRRARGLLERERVTRPVRLIGLSAGRLGSAGVGQLGLFDPHAVRRERLAQVIDRLTERFGEGAVIPAALLPRKGDIIPSS